MATFKATKLHIVFHAQDAHIEKKKRKQKIWLLRHGIKGVINAIYNKTTASSNKR